jgi:hypothetical protein
VLLSHYRRKFGVLKGRPSTGRAQWVSAMLLAMTAWHWLLWPLAVGVVVLGLYGLDRFCLWLEDRGWLYYRKKKPSSSPMSAWVAMQQFLEPGVKHVVHVGQERRSEGDEAAGKERLVANLLASLDATPVNPEEIRVYLAIAKEKGIDWRKLYDEAVQVQRAVRADRVDLIPPLADVAPQE